jgi:AraC family transcriptional regulator
MSAKLGKIHDVRLELARNASAIASLTAIAGGRRVGTHVHDNPYLALHLLGAYRDSGDGGQTSVDGPAALFFPSGSAHEMNVGGTGVATIIIEFDNDILARGFDADVDRPRAWVGGEIGWRARQLARAWLSKMSEHRRFDMTIEFLKTAFSAARPDIDPQWRGRLSELIEANVGTPDIEQWARELGMSRAWLIRSYRAWRGEGLGETIGRRRVEAAAILLEDREMTLVDIAARAGFCDQSHMNRAFRKFLGHTPLGVRAAHLGLAGEPAPGFAA